MRHLSENSIFVNTVVRDVKKYVEENLAECEPAVDIDFVQRLTNAENESGNDNGATHQNIAESVDRLHKDFYSMWSYDTPQTSPRRAQSASMSPPYNAPSPSYSFPSSVSSSAASSPAPKR